MDLLTTARAAERAGCHVNTVKLAVARGALKPAVRESRMMMFRPQDIDRWNASRPKPGPKPKPKKTGKK